MPIEFRVKDNYGNLTSGKIRSRSGSRLELTVDPVGVRQDNEWRQWICTPEM